MLMHIRTHLNKSLTHSYKEEKQLRVYLFQHVRRCENGKFISLLDITLKLLLDFTNL